MTTSAHRQPSPVLSRPWAARVRGLLPMAYLALATTLAVLILPSALKPPPDPTNESGAVSPDAPPDNNPESIVLSTQQAAGAGAGATASGPSTTVPGAPAPAVTTTSKVERPSSGTCFGTPKRQTESVYSPPCGPAFAGNNGGATAHNVFPNEIRLSFNHALGAPPDGPVPEQPTPDERAEARTMRVLAAYANKRFETYGRHVRFYGTATHASAADDAAAAVKADEVYGIFGSYDLGPTYCQDMVRRKTVVFCDPQEHVFFTRNRPGMFSWQMDFEQMFGFGAEYACKKLKDRPADFSGSEKGRPRKFAVVTERSNGFGVPVQRFVEAFSRECGGAIAVPVELASNSEPAATAAAVARFRSEGVTTVLLNTGNANSIELMAAAGPSYTPEWVVMGNQGLDLNVSAQLLPPDQALHVFGISGWELPHKPAETECARAYHSIDPDNDPNDTTCLVFWHPMNMLLAGIQLAGPKLTPESFEKALFSLGHRYSQTAWSVGGGYGPDDYSYMDNVGEVWFDPNTLAPDNGRPGAYRWTDGGARARRGQLTADTSQLFKEGPAAAPPGS
jgi:hypothetical protein